MDSATIAIVPNEEPTAGWESEYIIYNDSIVQPDADAVADPDDQEVNSKLKGWRIYTGILFCMIGSLSMSMVALIVKLLPNYHPGTLAVWRYAGSLTPSIPILIYLVWWKEKNVFSSVWPLIGKKRTDERTNLIGVLARGISGGAVTILRFWALRYLSLADVSVITRSTPALVIILAYFFLDEKCSIISIFSAFLAISGVFILSRPPFLTGASGFDEKTLIGLGLSIGALVFSSITIVITRKLRKLNYALLIFCFGIVGMLEGIIMACVTGSFKLPQTSHDILLTLLLASLTFIGQLFSVLAVKFDGAGPISIVKTSYVPFAFLWQIIFLHVFPDFFSILGASIIMVGIVLIAVRKCVQNLPDESKMKKHLRCISL